MPVNRISLDITGAQKTAVADAAAALDDATKPFNVVVTKEELKSVSKLGDIRIACVEKVAQYAVSKPEFLQPNADVPEFQKDLKTFKDTREMVRPIKQVVDNLENTMRVSGSEAWKFTRDYYKTVQFNAKMGVPGAQTIYDDLRPLFEAKETTPEPDE